MKKREKTPLSFTELTPKQHQPSDLSIKNSQIIKKLDKQISDLRNQIARLEKPAHPTN